MRNNQRPTVAGHMDMSVGSFGGCPRSDPALIIKLRLSMNHTRGWYVANPAPFNNKQKEKAWTTTNPPASTPKRKTYYWSATSATGTTGVTRAATIACAHIATAVVKAKRTAASATSAAARE